MKTSEINIRDPFIVHENGKYYLYGTRAANFGRKTAGFDVYVSSDLENWSNPVNCFDSEKNGMNREVNWAPEVHKYNGRYYLFATFTKENNLRGTYSLVSDSPLGPFVPHSDGALTPFEWECLDGTLYVSKDGKPYLVFCHEHTQIIDGTICYMPLNDDLSKAIGEPTLIFAGSEPYYINSSGWDGHFITDGPYMYRTKNGTLLMLWSTSVNGKYAECIARSDNGEIDGKFEHLDPIITDDGGHGMIFRTDDSLMLTFHAPNRSLYEKPVFREIVDNGAGIELKK